MMNACFLVGTVVTKPVVEKKKNGDTYCSMVMKADRPFMNAEGMIEEDVFHVEVWRGIAEEVERLCEEGCVIAVKGRLKSEVKEENGTSFYACHVVAEAVSYPERRNLINKTKK